MLLLELNEFNLALLEAAVAREDLPNLATLLRWPRAATTTADREETGFLEPWVEWVSVHTGRPSAVHGIRHLGDVPNLDTELIWERLDRHGVTTGVWGAMNGARRDARRCRFFLPDPWTFSEPAHPAALAPLLALPRYLARNYLGVSRMRVARLGMGFAAALVRAVGLRDVVLSLGLLRQGLARFGLRHFVVIAWFEYLSGLAFLRQYARHAPQFAILFVNSIAHVQHHYWTAGTRGVTPEIAFTLGVIDRLLGRVLAALGEAVPIVVMNALTQENTSHEPPWILYRQKDPEAFLRAAGLAPSAVEPLMTYDAHVFFPTARDGAAAREVLAAAAIGGRPLFAVEPDPVNPCKLFYRIDFAEELPDDARLTVNGRDLPFFAWFAAIVRRTGRHGPDGTVFTRHVALPPQLANHEVCAHLCRHFGIGEDAAGAREAPRERSLAPS
jgi:hypothetical protein